MSVAGRSALVCRHLPVWRHSSYRHLGQPKNLFFPSVTNITYGYTQQQQQQHRSISTTTTGETMAGTKTTSFEDKKSSTALSFGPSTPAQHYVVVGERSTLASAWEAVNTLSGCGTTKLPRSFVDGAASTASFYTDSNEGTTTITAVHLAKDSSRNLGHVRADLIHGIVTKHVKSSDATTQVVLVLDNDNQVIPAATAVARALPAFSVKTSSSSSSSSSLATSYNDEVEKKTRKVNVDYIVHGSTSNTGKESVYNELNALGTSVRLAGRLVDMPCCILHTDRFLEEVKEVVSANSNTLSLEVIQGEDLDTRGFGGLWNVGKAATHLPALAVIKYTPLKPTPGCKTVSLVGKGIVYDTGGLSIKSTANMSGMKGDMGGSAAVLGAVLAAAKINHGGVLYGVLCLAENACGSRAQRVDDVYTGYSGKTVEVNNTDAEGRLVLGDGVAYASKDLKTDYILDIATLTGAQMITTGMLHGAVLTPSETLEASLRTAGNDSGDWVFPILYAPEILLKEFDSPIADMKNSVKSRLNAQSSCAGHFIEQHLSKEWEGTWAHIDIAGPAERDARGTGFGVGLFIAFLKSLK